MSDLIIKLKGGTGNQLFQAIAAFCIAIKCNKKCKYSIHKIGNNKYKRRLEILPLLEFLNVEMYTQTFNNNILYLDEYDIDHPIYWSNNSPLKYLNNDIQIEGYFTNYRIHNLEILGEIKKFFKNLNFEKNLFMDDYIAIHIRELHGTGIGKINKKIENLNINYYIESLNKIMKNVNLSHIKKVVLFSDMSKNAENSILLPQIKSLLNERGLKYIDGDNEIKSTLELIKVFSFSKACIISNSTLSWWGAYLSKGDIYSPVMNLWEPSLKVPDHWNQVYSNEIIPLTHHKKNYFYPTVTNNASDSNKKYTFRRLKLINFIRICLSNIEGMKIIRSFKRFCREKGIMPVNKYSTFN